MPDSTPIFNFLKKCVLIFLLGKTGLYSQVNLIQNSGFEILSTCPTNYSQINLATGWDTVPGGGSGTPDIYNMCSSVLSPPNSPLGFQYPRTGAGYSGLIFYTSGGFAEYMQYHIPTTLKVQKIYCFTGFANLANSSGIATTEIGIYFDNGSMHITPAMVSPPVQASISSPVGQYISDTANWVKIEGLYTAIGNENYMTIGNFKGPLTSYITVNSSNTPAAYYYFDDFSLIEYNQAFAGSDTSICSGDSVYIGAPIASGYSSDWFVNGVQIKTDTCGFWVNPNQSQTYIVKNDMCGILSYDTIYIDVLKCNTGLQSHLSIPNVFTPNGDNVNDTLNVSIENGFIEGVSIYNRWGNIVCKSDSSGKTYFFWDGHTTSGEACNPGTYYYVISYTNSQGEQKNRKGICNAVSLSKLTTSISQPLYHTLLYPVMK